MSFPIKLISLWEMKLPLNGLVDYKAYGYYLITWTKLICRIENLYCCSSIIRNMSLNLTVENSFEDDNI